MRREPECAPPPAAEGGFELRRFLPLLVVAAITLVVFAMGWHRALSLENLVRHRATIDGFVAAHRGIAIGAFMAIYIAATSLSLPGSFILTIAGGMLFGLLLGALAAIVAATIGAIVIFLIARSAFGEHLVRRAGPAIAKLAAGFRANAFSYLLFLRLVPLFPFWLINLASAFLNVPLGLFAAATAIGIIPGALVFTFIGTGFDSAIAAEERAYRACLANGGSDCRLNFDVKTALTPELLAALAALGALALLPVLVRRLKARRQAAGSAG
jgi:uncharacterized membrane protein YdjX (TVP38/TMEM64 family)